jgi:hypothetical protein
MAFNVNVPDYIIDASKKFVMACNVGQRGDGSDGNQEQQLTGAIGQNVLLAALGQPFMVPSNGPDGGVDATISGMTFDIKTMGRTVTPRIYYVNNILKSQVKYNVDGYIFASLNKNTMALTICGWLPKDQFLSRAKLYEKGETRTRADNTTFQMRAANYEICMQDVFYMAKNWQELFAEINLFSPEVTT